MWVAAGRVARNEPQHAHICAAEKIKIHVASIGFDVLRFIFVAKAAWKNE